MNITELWSTYWPHWTIKTYIIFILTVIILSFALTIYAKMHIWKIRQIVIAIVLLIYLLLVFASTVFTRTAHLDCKYELSLFWSYRWGYKIHGWKRLMKENILNILMLMPIGVLLPVIRPWIKGKYVILTGFFISFMIEFFQLVLRRGLFEFDDMIHNTLGVAMGYLLYKTVRCVIRHENK